MMKEFQRSWDQVTLSAEADARISVAIEAARQERGEGSPHGNTAKKGAFRLSRGAAVAAVLAALLIVTAAAAGLYHTTLRVRSSVPNPLIVHTRTRTYIAGREMVEVSFEDTIAPSGGVGLWEPTMVPAGFEKVERAEPYESDQSRSDIWTNADGEEFRLFYLRPSGSGSFYDPDRILEQGDVSVNGVAAWYLVYRNSSGGIHTNLYWSDSDAGVGFILSSFDLSIDELIPIAESVVPCESHTAAESVAP